MSTEDVNLNGMLLRQYKTAYTDCQFPSAKACVRQYIVQCQKNLVVKLSATNVISTNYNPIDCSDHRCQLDYSTIPTLDD